MGAGREKVNRKPPPFPQFPPVFFFRLRAFSILRARLSRSLGQANSENWKQTERSMKLTAQNMERMNNKHSKYNWRHGWTNLKIETNCNRGFKKLVSLTVFESSFYFFFFVTFGVMLGGRRAILSFTNNFTFNCERCEAGSHFISRLSNRPGEHSHE